RPSIRQRRQAQRLLTERKSKAEDQILKSLQNGKSLEFRLASLWTLYTTGNLTDEMLQAISSDKEPAIRAWSARLTGERGEASANAIARLQKLAADPDPLVRSFVAYAARRLANPATIPIVATLLQQPSTEK